jgi:hypothetical protein
VESCTFSSKIFVSVNEPLILIYLWSYLAVESGKAAEPLEEQGLRFDAELNPPQQPGGGSPLVALLGVVEEPEDKVINLFSSVIDNLAKISYGVCSNLVFSTFIVFVGKPGT